MSQIQRYGFWHDKEWKGQPGEFEQMPEGPYVLYSDYEALQRENERLKAPVSDEEWPRCNVIVARRWISRAEVDALIASRAIQPAPQEPK